MPRLPALPMPTDGTLHKRSVMIAGHRTSVALEKEFWEGIDTLAALRDTSVPKLLQEIDAHRAVHAPAASLASAARVYVLTHLPLSRSR